MLTSTPSQMAVAWTRFVDLLELKTVDLLMRGIVSFNYLGLLGSFQSV